MFLKLQEFYPLSEEKVEKFKKFKELLLKYNKMFNLTALLSDEDVEIKHFLDSLLGEKYFLKGESVVEVGSGGGFPSVPLMIYRPDLKFTLIESTQKKCEFLKTVINELNLNASVYNMRAEEAGKNKDFREKFDVVTARAVARLNSLLEYCVPLIKTGGRTVLYKGDAESEIEEAENAIKVLNLKVKKIEKYTLEEDMKRTLFVSEKLKPTDLKYPRGNGKERSKPL